MDRTRHSNPLFAAFAGVAVVRAIGRVRRAIAPAGSTLAIPTCRGKLR